MIETIVDENEFFAALYDATSITDNFLKLDFTFHSFRIVSVHDQMYTVNVFYSDKEFVYKGIDYKGPTYVYNVHEGVSENVSSDGPAIASYIMIEAKICLIALNTDKFTFMELAAKF